MCGGGVGVAALHDAVGIETEAGPAGLRRDGAEGQQGPTWRGGAGDLGYSGEDGAVAKECRRTARRGGAVELRQASSGRGSSGTG